MPGVFGAVERPSDSAAVGSAECHRQDQNRIAAQRDGKMPFILLESGAHLLTEAGADVLREGEGLNVVIVIGVPVRAVSGPASAPIGVMWGEQAALVPTIIFDFCDVLWLGEEITAARMTAS